MTVVLKVQAMTMMTKNCHNTLSIAIRGDIKMSSDGEYIPDEVEADASSSVPSGGSSDFIASDDDESSESNDDVSYHQPPELSEEEDCNTRTQHATPRKARQCTIETNEKMSQMLDEEELPDEDLFGSDNDTQDMNLCAPSSKLGVPSSQYQYSTPARNRGTRRKCTEQTNEKIHQMLEEEDLSDEEVFGSDTQDMGRNLLLGAPSLKLDAPSKQNKLSTKFNSRRERKRNIIDYADSDGNNGGKLRKRKKGSCNLDSVFDFHGTSSEEEDNQLAIPVTRSSKKSRRRRSSNNGNDHDGMGSLSRGSLQNELHNEFDIDSSVGEGSIFSNNQEGGSSDEGGSSEETNKKDNHLMGSKVLYCCPICYKKAYQSQGNLGGNVDKDDSSVDSESSSDDVGDRKMAADPFLFSDDPMTILVNIGLETAATFCFETLGGVDKYVDMGVKDHMEIIHGIDSSALVDNELFQRFKVRDGDSLLQRWLRHARAGNPGQMDMQDYWLRDGNNDQFNHLARMVNKIHRQMMHSGEFAWETFSESFPNRAKKLWNKLSYPYLRQHEEEEDSDGSSDIVDDEDIEQQEGFMPQPVLPGDEESDVGEIVAALQERYNQSKNEEEYDTDDSSSDDNEDEDDTHKGAGQRTSSGTRITPISELDLRSNRWTIRATVTSKRDIRDWSNKNGEGTVFSIDLLDSSGDVQCAFFNEAADKFYPILEVGRTYLFSGGRIKAAWRHNQCSSQFEISFDERSDIVLVDDDDDTSTAESAEEENDSGVVQSDGSEEFDENESEEEQDEEKKTKSTSRDDSLQPSHTVSPNRAANDIDDEDIEQEEYKPPPVLPGDQESDAEEYIAQHLPNLSDPVRRERYSQELQEERDVDNLSPDENEDEEGVDSHVSDEAASTNISFLTSDHSNDRDFVVMADGTWKPKDDEDSISSLSKEENESEEESDSNEEEDSEDESSEEEQDEWMKKRKMKPTAAIQKESIRQKDNSSDSDEDDSLRPSHISPDQAEFGGDLVDTDDEQTARVQPRQLEYSPEKKKRKRIDDSDDES